MEENPSGKIDMQGESNYQSFKLTLHHHFQGHHKFNQQGSFNFQCRQTLDLKYKWKF
jgi:hypothetical protein